MKGAVTLPSNGFGLYFLSEVLFPSAPALGSLCLQGPGPKGQSLRRRASAASAKAELSPGLRGSATSS